MNAPKLIAPGPLPLSPALGTGPMRFCVEGHDGAGKTPVCEGVAKALDASGIKVFLAAPFREVNNARLFERLRKDGLEPEKMTDGARRDYFIRERVDVFFEWGDAARAGEALAAIKRHICAKRAEATAGNFDVILFDRHWLTVLVSLLEFCRYDLATGWDDFVPAFFLETPVAKTLAGRAYDPRVEHTSPQRLELYHGLYLDVLARNTNFLAKRFLIGGNRADLRPVIEGIADHIREQLTKRRAG